jgi:hypothetical protein
MAKKARNPYAVCNAQKSRAGRRWSKAKFERCVRDVKRKSR